MRDGAERGAGRVGPREASLGFVPLTLATRLFAGAPFAAAWAASVVVPLVRVVESDVPFGLFVAAMTTATLAPVLLYLRRHALHVRLRWDEHTVTLLRGGRVATSIAWADATVRERAQAGGRDRTRRVVQIVDRSGRMLTLATGTLVGLPMPTGRARIDGRALDDVLRAARARATFVDEPLVPEPRALAMRALGPSLLAGTAIAILSSTPSLPVAQLGAVAFACTCVALLIDPARRLRAALARPEGRETLVIDTEERGRVRARRLDGSRVLLDITAAGHPDAMLSSRRGFVNAVLVVPADGTGTPYRSLEEPIAATFVETRDDRVLRFEHLRAALVDVVGYGSFFATSIAAALLA